MGPKGLLDDGMGGQMGDYRPEVQEGAANREYQQSLMGRNFPDPNSNIDPQQAEKMASLLREQGQMEAASILMGAVGGFGLGTGAVAAATGAGAPIAAPLLGLGVSSGVAADGLNKMGRTAGLKAEGINSERYPGIYGSQ
jgi:hypothetical protein